MEPETQINKKAIIITTVVVVLALVGWFVYEFTSNKSPAPIDKNRINVNGGASGATNPDLQGMDNLSGSASTTSLGDGSGSSISPAVKEFTIEASNFSFSPSVITVDRGDTIKITFKNTDGYHDFKINELNVTAERISGGQEEIIQFMADKAGTFEYYCSVNTHKTMGMKGTLMVRAFVGS